MEKINTNTIKLKSAVIVIDKIKAKLGQIKMQKKLTIVIFKSKCEIMIFVNQLHIVDLGYTYEL